MNRPVSAHDLRSTTGFNPTGDSPRSLYIHVPFCRHRCGYCNFSLVAGRDYLVERFLNAIEIEIGWLERSYEIDTLFLGGGTPSHLGGNDFRRLMGIISSRFSFSNNAEISMECNPSDVTADKVAVFADEGINRISLGVQSFDNEKLKRLERDHDTAIVARAVDDVRARIDNVSMDLIFATPEETLATWESDLRAAVKLEPTHLSTYELTWEKGTQFWNRLHRNELKTAPEELSASMYESAIGFLADHGLCQYEVSSFAVEGKRCRHNLQYWNRQPWFAFGPGAARFIDGVRQTNHGSAMHYFKKIEAQQSPVADIDHLQGRRAAAEGLAIALRQIDGVLKTQFESQHRFSMDDVLGDLKDTLLRHRLAIETGELFRLTHAGVMMCDRISVELLSANEP